MKTLLLAAASAMIVATPAFAQSSIFDNFDGENGGATALNYTNFANFNVAPGTVDLLHQPNSYTLTCAGGSGSCVDLDGSTNMGGTLTTKNMLSYLNGSHVTLSFDLSGNQRTGPGTFDDFFAGFNFSNPTVLSNVTYGGGFGGFTLPNSPFPNSGFQAGGNIISPSTPFTNYSISFDTNNAGSLNAFIGTGSHDNIGPILDNFSLSVSGGVPEPATWALMIIGFGGIGAAMRGRRRSATLANA